MRSNTQEECKVLALSGGGVRGLYTISVLATLEKAVIQRTGQKDFRIGNCFDLVCGTSIGGIIAIGLAHGYSAQDLYDVLRKNVAEIFKKKGLARFELVRNLVRLKTPLYSPDSLAQVLLTLFGGKTIGDLPMQPRLVVPAINITSGRLKVFKTPHHIDLSMDTRFRLVDVALATSAAPTFFPVHEIEDSWYVDGGLIVNSPAMLGMLEAHRYLGYGYRDIKLISVGTMGSPMTVTPKGGFDRGLFNWGQMGTDLTLLAMSASERLHDDMASLYLAQGNTISINTKPDPEQGKILDLDNASEEALKILASSGESAAADTINQPLMKSILGLGSATKGAKTHNQEVTA